MEHMLDSQCLHCKNCGRRTRPDPFKVVHRVFKTVHRVFNFEHSYSIYTPPVFNFERLNV